VYCYTHVNDYLCIFNELQLWSFISSDQPNFLKAVAGFTKVTLPPAYITELDDLHEKFYSLNSNVISHKRAFASNPKRSPQLTNTVRKLIDSFIAYDTQALALYTQLLSIGRDNDTWQELVKHIIGEQNFMLELFKDLAVQLS
jgi:hypothetical protein